MIIPQNIFTNPFSDIVNNIQDVVTESERKLLILFERYCYKDGKIFPKIKTIAWKLNKSTRQVQRLIASLVKKGFIKVIPASLLDRHLYGKGNQYHLLDHPAYNDQERKGEMSSEMSSENSDGTFIYNKYNKTKNGFDFNIVEFLKNNQQKHGQAIIDALNALVARWPSIRLPGAYAQKIVEIQSGNYFEAEFTERSEADKEAENSSYAAIAEGLGLNLSREDQQEETPIDIAKRMNEQRNKLFEMFPQRE